MTDEIILAAVLRSVKDPIHIDRLGASDDVWNTHCWIARQRLMIFPIASDQNTLDGSITIANYKLSRRGHMFLDQHESAQAGRTSRASVRADQG